MSKKRVVAKDPDAMHNELLRKEEELRAMKQRMNDLQEEHKKVKSHSSRLEKLAKRDQNGLEDGTTLLNPRDAASTSNLIGEQKRLLEEKDRQIRSLLAGNRMEHIGGKKIGSDPRSIYGSGSTKKPAKRVAPMSARTATAATNKPLSASNSRSQLHTPAHAPNMEESHDDHPPPVDVGDEPDFQSAPLSRVPSGRLSRSNSVRGSITPQRSPKSSPSPRARPITPRARSASIASPTTKDSEQHYLEFNKRLQERLNSSQTFHRTAMDNGSGGSGGMNSGGGGGGQGPFSDADDMDGPPGDMNELVWIRRELRQKKAKIAALQNHFEHLTVSFRVEKDLQKMTLAQCEELKQTVSALQLRERTYQRQLESLTDSQLQLDNQASIIADLQSDKRGLEERIAHLHTNLFQGDTMEALRHKQLLQEHQSSLLKLQTDLEEKDRTIKSLKQANASLLEKTQYNDQLLRDKKDLQAENTELRNKCTDLTEKLIVFSVDSGVEVDDLERALDIVRRQRAPDADRNRLNFLGKTTGGEGAAGAIGEDDPALDTVPALRRKYAELEIQARDYILEIQQKTDMLNTQYTINKEQKKKLGELTKKLTTVQVELERARYELVHRPAVADTLSDSIFAGSEDGDAGLAADQLTGLENLIAFRVLNGTLKSTAGVFRDTPSPLTFLTADFYEFESSFSEVFGGFQPEYKFTTQYQVDADEFLIQYLEKEELVLTLYQQLQGTNYKKLAVCYIPLRGLLAPAAAIEGRAQLLLVNDPSIGGVRGMLRDGMEEDESKLVAAGLAGRHPEAVLGEIHYILRMKRPILSTPPSPALSGANTPMAMRSRQGSIAGIGGSYAPSAFQPSIGSTLASHHANRDLHVAPMPSRASMLTGDSNTNSPNIRPTQTNRQTTYNNNNRQPSQQQQQQPSSSFQPSQQQHTRGLQSQLSGPQLTMSDFDQHQQQHQSQQPVSLFGQQRQQQSQPDDPFDSSPTLQAHPPPQRAQQQLRPSASQTLATNVGAGTNYNNNNTNNTANSTRPAHDAYSRQSSLSNLRPTMPPQQSVVSSDVGFDRRPSLQPQSTLFTAADVHTSSQPSTRRSSSIRRTAEQEEKDIQDLLNNPDEQDGLFGNELNSDRRRADEDEFF